MVAEPATSPVTGTLTDVPPAGPVTLGGTVATEGLLELRFIVMPPPEAGPDRCNVSVCDPPAPIVTEVGEKLMLEATITAWMPLINPGAEAVTNVDPKPTPVTSGIVT